MEALERKNILQDVLTEQGYSGWYVIEPIKLVPENCFLLLNPKEKKLGEVSIPDEWLGDPRRRSAIGELLTRTIQTCGDVPRARPSPSMTGVEYQSSAHNTEYRK
jgi:hypothetical protein